MPKSETRTFRSDFRRFFIKGLAVLLPTVLTLWILVKAYEFIDVTIAQPINGGIRFVMAQATPHLELFQKNFDPSEVAIEKELARLKSEEAANVTMASVTKQLRTNKIMTWWQARWYMNFIGIIVAILAVYIAGRLLGGFLGRRIQGRLERLLTSIPLIKQIYPYVKQVVDFLISDDKPLKFNRVVMVEYPRKGLWSVGAGHRRADAGGPGSHHRGRRSRNNCFRSEFAHALHRLYHHSGQGQFDRDTDLDRRGAAIHHKRRCTDSFPPGPED